MGKLLDNLNKQLKRPEQRNDAEECLIIYKYLKDTTGHVWESTWNILTDVKFIGIYPNAKRHYLLSSMGRTFLQGIRASKTESNSH